MLALKYQALGGASVSKEPLALYVERQGDLEGCRNKYVVFYRNLNKCAAVLIQDNFQMHLNGNVSILLSAISRLEVQPVCPELNVDILPRPGMNQTAKCTRVKGYNKHITCNLVNNGVCRLQFPSNCNTTIHHGEVSLQCLNNGVIQIQESLLTYPDDTPVLDLSNNNIVRFNINSREPVENDLNVFVDLHMLDVLYIDKNRLTRMNEDSF